MQTFTGCTPLDRLYQATRLDFMAGALGEDAERLPEGAPGFSLARTCHESARWSGPHNSTPDLAQALRYLAEHTELLSPGDPFKGMFQHSFGEAHATECTGELWEYTCCLFAGVVYYALLKDAEIRERVEVLKQAGVVDELLDPPLAKTK